MHLETRENNLNANNLIVVLCHTETKQTRRDISMRLIISRVYEVRVAANEDVRAVMILVAPHQ